jgi:hypothetical protein
MRPRLNHLYRHLVKLKLIIRDKTYMSTAIRNILMKSLVKRFYRQHAALLLFLFILFFGVISPSNQLTYHYHLMLGILNAPGMAALAFTGWLVYAAKCSHFITGCIRHPDYSFLHLLSLLDHRTAYRRLLMVQCWIFLPVYGYALALAGVGIYTAHYAVSGLVLLYASLLCLLSVRRYLHLLHDPE